MWTSLNLSSLRKSLVLPLCGLFFPSLGVPYLLDDSPHFSIFYLGSSRAACCFKNRWQSPSVRAHTHTHTGAFAHALYPNPRPHTATSAPAVRSQVRAFDTYRCVRPRQHSWANGLEEHAHARKQTHTDTHAQQMAIRPVHSAVAAVDNSLHWTKTRRSLDRAWKCVFVCLCLAAEEKSCELNGNLDLITPNGIKIQELDLEETTNTHTHTHMQLNAHPRPWPQTGFPRTGPLRSKLFYPNRFCQQHCNKRGFHARLKDNFYFCVHCWYSPSLNMPRNQMKTHAGMRSEQGNGKHQHVCLSTDAEHALVHIHARGILDRETQVHCFHSIIYQLFNSSPKDKKKQLL